MGEFDNQIKVKIQSPPIDGQANKELIHFLSKELNLPKMHIQIVKGEGSRRKLISLPYSDEMIDKLNSILKG